MSPSFLLDTLDSVYQMIDEWGVSPVVAGGLAVSFWGHPRSTRDIDLAILVANIDSFESRLRESGLVPSKEPHIAQLGFVQVSQWRMALRDAFIDIDIDFLISASPYHASALQRAQECRIPGTRTTMRVLTCEDLLLFKAKSGRMIDLADIEVLLELRRGQLNIEYLQKKSQEIGLDPSRWNVSI